MPLQDTVYSIVYSRVTVSSGSHLLLIPTADGIHV